MSDVETAVRPLIDRLEQRQAQLSTDDQLVLMRWAVKTALIFDAYSGDTGVIAQEGRTAFMKSVTKPSDGQFPDGVFVWLAHYKGEWVTSFVGGALRGPGDHPASMPPIGYFSTLSIGCTVFQILILTEAAIRASARPEWDYWEERMALIYPCSSSVSWPPRQSLDDTSLDGFATRWQPQHPDATARG